jgi:SAM-dependent methyltransferase
VRLLALQPRKVLAGYDAVCSLYPYVPPLSHWRAWEYAAYQRYRLTGRILDLGCGDGRYFRLLWPRATDVIGVDIDPTVAELGRQSDVYRKVHVSPAYKIPEGDGTFDHVFANCSLEHMDHLDKVLTEVNRCLKPGGRLLCSVVTDRLVQWSILPHFVSLAGFAEAAKVLEHDFLEYHNLVNPLATEEWGQRFANANLTPEEYIPIMPKCNTGIFLLMDSIWHIKQKENGELGDIIHPFLSANPNFPTSFRKIFQGLLDMEMDWQDCSGAVFWARKER